MQRTDIRQSDLFISWTGKDAELKDKIISFLRQKGISCTESDYSCAGDFRQWSREAVEKSTVFLLLYTENTINSEYVPIEIEELQKIDDYQNRCVPVVSDYGLYAENLPQLAENISAVVLNGRELTEDYLEKILYNVQTLINNRNIKIYKEATKPTYLRLVSMLKSMHIAEREFNHESLYINRSVSDEDGREIVDSSEFFNTNDILFLYGPAGSGKSCYIDQLRNSADENTLVLTLTCHKLADESNLFPKMFEEFKRYCGNRDFFTAEDFKSLISVKKLMLVLDGMDEIATENGVRKFLSLVENYYKENSESTTLFFTSRNEYDADLIAMNGQTPKKLELRSLQEDQIKAFGSNLFLLLGSPDKSNDFYVHIQDLADEIRTNPLLLSQLAIIYDKKNEIPKTTIGIYDAVCEITLSQKNSVADIPDDYREMVSRRLSEILKAFSAERYRLLSLGKRIDAKKIFTVVLKNEYSDAQYRAEFLTEYLRSRAIMIDGEFYHKMFLEYFTALKYYETAFDDYDEIENEETIRDLFSYYGNPYWSKVIEMFLVKADSSADEETTKALYELIMSFDICEYTVLFDVCKAFLLHKQIIQNVLVSDIMKKSAEGIYPPYGPLFWYVPEYNLYETCLIALEDLKEEPHFAKALALVRDVCFIMGGKYTAKAVTDKISFESVFAECGSSLSGIRKGLCELFFLGKTDFSGGEDIYPRCFNISEAKSFMENGCGVIGRMGTPFKDELELFSHNSYNILNNEYIGLVALPYDISEAERTMTEKPCFKLSGLILSSTDDTEMKYIAINRRHIRVIYIPENITGFDDGKNNLLWNMLNFTSFLPLSVYAAVTEDKIIYVSDTASLPEGIKEISDEMFAWNTLIKSLKLPSTVETIGENAFHGCSSLCEINIPDGVKEIGKGAFEYCTSLAVVTLPKDITEICCCLFGDCESLDSVVLPDSVRTISAEAFRNCRSLDSISIPDNTEKIGSEAFKNCISLKSIILSDNIKKVENHTFYGCSSLTSVSFSDSILEIGESAFSGCTLLASISLPKGIKEIGMRAFKNCASITAVNLSDSITTINYETFSGCTSLTSITFPESITEIIDEAFSKCSLLSTVKFPEHGLCNIGNNVFKGCHKMNLIENCPVGYNQKFLRVPDECVINCCSVNFQKIENLEGTEISDSQFEGRNDITSIQIPDNITKIGANAFGDCVSLTEIILPDSIKEIDNCAFGRCISLNSIVMQEGITRIGLYSFTNCTSLNSINLPDSIEDIMMGAFNGCTSLTSVALPKGITNIYDSLFSECESLVSMELPDGVRMIGEKAFKNCSSLVSISLPENLKVIGHEAFESCNMLESITLPEETEIIGRYAFSNCNSLATVTFPDNMREIGNEAFEGCTSLVSIVFPNNILKIGQNVFSGCTSLASATLPSNITKISQGIFFNCKSLAEIKLPEGIIEIEDIAFAGCSSLDSITLPCSITKIGMGAFYHCDSLLSVTIPESVRVIGDGAFADCENLREITLSRRFECELPRFFGGDVDLSKIKVNWI